MDKKTKRIKTWYTEYTRFVKPKELRFGIVNIQAPTAMVEEMAEMIERRKIHTI